jgi:hypothetical protein
MANRSFREAMPLSAHCACQAVLRSGLLAVLAVLVGLTALLMGAQAIAQPVVQP